MKLKRIVEPISPIYPIRQMKKEKETLDEEIYATPATMQAVVLTLAQAKQHGLEAEVMWSALTMAAEANEHGLNMEQVLEAALGEWDIAPQYEMDVKEIERHRGLEIGEDGTVNELI
jgi:hypothetical protein